MATKDSNVGKELYTRGWRQGGILRAAEIPVPVVFREVSMASRAASISDGAATAPGEHWAVRTEVAGPEDYLLVVSQDCDIAKDIDTEPHIEVVRATFVADKERINMARGKSYHYRLLGLRDDSGGREEGLIADAAWRAILDKLTLLTLRPEFYVPPRCAPTIAVIQDWLGARFSRLALPDDVVQAVQRPLVEAIRKLKKTQKTHRLHTTMAKIDYVVCVLRSADSPMGIELWFVVDEDGDNPSIPWDEAAELAEWIDSVLVKAGGAKVADWDRYTTDMLSFRQFNSHLVLDLDQFSPLE